jgi:hypothetical protein
VQRKRGLYFVYLQFQFWCPTVTNVRLQLVSPALLSSAILFLFVFVMFWSLCIIVVFSFLFCGCRRHGVHAKDPCYSDGVGQFLQRLIWIALDTETNFSFGTIEKLMYIFLARLMSFHCSVNTRSRLVRASAVKFCQSETSPSMPNIPLRFSCHICCSFSPFTLHACCHVICSWHQ